MTERLANPSCDVVRRLSITRMLYHRIAPYASDTMTVLVNTGSTLMQAADDEERVVGQRTVLGARRIRVLNEHTFTCMYYDLFPGWQVDK